MSQEKLDVEIEAGLKRSKEMLEKQAKNKRIILSILVVVLFIIALYAAYSFGTRAAIPPQASATAIYTNITTAIAVTPTTTTIAQTPTPTITDESAPKALNQTQALTLCTQPKTETCYNKPAIKYSTLLITLWIKDFDKTEIPYIKIGSEKFVCTLSTYYPDPSISCSHGMMTSGTFDITLFSLQDKELSSGSIKLDLIAPVVPTATKKKSYP